MGVGRLLRLNRIRKHSSCSISSLSWLSPSRCRAEPVEMQHMQSDTSNPERHISSKEPRWQPRSARPGQIRRRPRSAAAVQLSGP